MQADAPRLEVVIVAALCVWRLTHLVVAEDGPWDVIARLRRTAARVLPAGLFACFYCATLWTAVGLAVILADGWRARLLLALAASAGAIVLERVSTGPRASEVAVSYFEPEVEDGVLRTENRSVAD